MGTASVSVDALVCKADNGLEGPILRWTLQLNFSRFGFDNRGERCLSNRQTRELMSPLKPTPLSRVSP